MPSDSPTLTPPRSPFLGFREPTAAEELPQLGPIPNPGSSPEESPEPAPGSVDDWQPDESDPSDATPWTESSTDGEPTRVPNPLAGEGLRDVFRGGVLIAGHQAHSVLARTEGQREAGLYLTDPEDAERIGDPLARIAARHEGVAGKVNPDTADLLAAMVGLTRYATKQIARNTVAKQIDGAGNVQTIPTEPVDL